MQAVICGQVYGYQSMKAGSQAEQLLGGFVRQGVSLPIEGAPPVIASKYFTIPVSLLGGRILRLHARDPAYSRALLGGAADLFGLFKRHNTS